MENLKFDVEKVLANMDKIIDAAKNVKMELEKYKQWEQIVEAEEVADESIKTKQLQRQLQPKSKPKSLNDDNIVYNIPPDFTI